MASTKYRKREKPTNTDDKKKLSKPDSGGDNGPILDTPRDALVAPRVEPTPEPAKPVHVEEAVEQEAPIAPEEPGEKVIDSIKIEDAKNVFEIKLIKKANRLTRVAFYLNGIETRPHTYAGHTSGISYFHLLKLTQKR